MKAFVYDKKESKKVAELKNIVSVTEDKESHSIYIVDSKNRLYQYNTKDTKTTIYQN